MSYMFLATSQKRFYRSFLNLTATIITLSIICSPLHAQQPTIEHISVEKFNQQSFLSGIHTNAKNWELDQHKISLFSLEIDDELFKSGEVLNQKLEASFEIIENIPTACCYGYLKDSKEMKQLAFDV